MTHHRRRLLPVKGRLALNNEPDCFVVDLDGTLIEESVMCLMLRRSFFRRPIRTIIAGLCYALLGPNSLTDRHGMQNLYLLKLDSIDEMYLRFNRSLIKFLRNLQDLGKTLILATGSDQYIADTMAQVLYRCFNIKFAHVIGSTPGFLCISKNKLAKVRNIVTSRFAYIGDSYQDFPLWSSDDVDMICVGSSYFKTNAERVCKKSGNWIPPDFDYASNILPLN